MKLSTKGRYAMVALADIALQGGEALVTLGDISKRQDISLPYLEQLFVKLRRAGLVDSKWTGTRSPTTRRPDPHRTGDDCTKEAPHRQRGDELTVD